MNQIQWNGLLISYDIVASETDGTMGPADLTIEGIADNVAFADFLREEDCWAGEIEDALIGVICDRVREWILLDQFDDLKHAVCQDFEDEVAQALDDMQEAKRVDP